MSAPDDTRLIDAGIAAAPLIADPKTWINRRVETVELLSHEEVRRQVSVDFTLTREQRGRLETIDGIVVPLTVLVKERRRAFDLRDEGGAAVPVLGRSQNGELALAAMFSVASAAMPGRVADEELEAIVAELRHIVFDPPELARHAFERLLGGGAVEGSARAAIATDQTCRALLDALWLNYVLCAVLPANGPNRRILKYSYAEDMGRPGSASWSERFSSGRLAYQLWYPDRRVFLVSCPGAWRARSFHAEVVIPEELRFGYAALHDAQSDDPVSDIELDVNRAALHAPDIGRGEEIVAALEIAPEGSGRTSQASVTSLVVAAMLWLGAASGLDAESPDATVSILLAGAAVFAGVTAVLGEHRLVSAIFSGARRWLFVVTLAAVAGSASLALELPDSHPVDVWSVAAVGCTVAAARLGWSSLRSRA